MPEKTPRLRPHEANISSMSDLARKGHEMYHPPYNRFIKPYEQKLGQLSMTDGVPVIHEVPPEDLPPIAA